MALKPVGRFSQNPKLYQKAMRDPAFMRTLIQENKKYRRDTSIGGWTKRQLTADSVCWCCGEVAVVHAYHFAHIHRYRHHHNGHRSFWYPQMFNVCSACHVVWLKGIAMTTPQTERHFRVRVYRNKYPNLRNISSFNMLVNQFNEARERASDSYWSIPTYTGISCRE